MSEYSTLILFLLISAVAYIIFMVLHNIIPSIEEIRKERFKDLGVDVEASFMYPEAEDFKPQNQTDYSAGVDLHAVRFLKHYRSDNKLVEISEREKLILYPGQRVIISSGIMVKLPIGYELQVRSRSGLSSKFGVIVLNAPGTIDPDYLGEVCAIVTNTSKKPYTILYGDRICQVVLSKYERANLRFVERFSVTTKRGTDGFGSTGR